MTCSTGKIIGEHDDRSAEIRYRPHIPSGDVPSPRGRRASLQLIRCRARPVYSDHARPVDSTQRCACSARVPWYEVSCAGRSRSFLSGTRIPACLA